MQQVTDKKFTNNLIADINENL